jgi:type IV fimbrial biogenesis protein FimT
MSRMLAAPGTQVHANPIMRWAGVTLMEMLIAMVIAIMLAGMAVPGYQHLVQRQRVDAAMHQLSAYMATARLTAINHRVVTVVCPSDGQGRCRQDGDWTHGWLMFLDRDGNRQPDDTWDILREERAPIHPSLRIVSGTGRPQLRYLPDGRSGGSNLTVRLCQDDILRGSVIVNNMGRVRAARPSRSQACGG